MTELINSSIPARLEPLLHRTTEDERPVIVMTCGIAGSGKTTLAKAIVQKYPHFTRLSGDEIIFEKHGLYDIGYPADEKLHAQYQAEQDEVYMTTFQKLLAESHDVVLDRSFYAKEDRDAFKDIIEKAGVRWVLVYLKSKDKDQLWQRICARSKMTKEANNALDITRATFDRYWAGFEEPEGEGELAILID